MTRRLARALAAAGMAAALTACASGDPAARRPGDRSGAAGATAPAARPSVPGTFCGTVVALNASSDEEPVTVEEPGPGDATGPGGPAVRAAAERQVALFDQLERTAPADLRAEAELVADLGREFARTTVDGDVGGITSRMVGDWETAQRTIHAYEALKVATGERCGVRLDLEQALPVQP